MRVTLGNRKRLYVYGIRIGETPVKRVMYGGRQIWPSNDDRAASLAVDMSFFPGTEDEAYWLHALNAVENFSSRNRYMKLTAGGGPIWSIPCTEPGTGRSTAWGHSALVTKGPCSRM